MAPLNPPPRHLDATPGDRNIYIVTNPKTGEQRQAQVLHRRGVESYVHYLNTNRRLDEWISETHLRVAEPHEITEPLEQRGRKRKRVSRAASPSCRNGESRRSASVTESESDDSDEEEHNKVTDKRNFDRVNFGHWQIKTWYFSPYPVIESEEDEIPASSDPFKAARAADKQRSALRAHGRTANLIASGLDRKPEQSGYSTLWVCDRCFKYMRDGVQWEIHTKNCKLTHPPGRKVYQRGAHIIWEVDGAKEKLFCQNLSLFGKLFIDVKTLFFDTDNFMFYILTDGDSQRDHVLGFFSKEKFSYDGYNLACIVTLPPYQRKGYGMLLIEFSYELSRREGMLGTPEQPLSDLGLQSYNTFWTAVLVRFFRRVLTVGPTDVNSNHTWGGDPWVDAHRRKKRMRLATDAPELIHNVTSGPMNATEAPFFDTCRRIQTLPNPDGSATTHVVVNCTLEDISKATSLHPTDTAFALKECGLLQRRRIRKPSVDGTGEEDIFEDCICISREMVEAVAKARRVKRSMMDPSCILL